MVLSQKFDAWTVTLKKLKSVKWKVIVVMYYADQVLKLAKRLYNILVCCYVLERRAIVFMPCPIKSLAFPWAIRNLFTPWALLLSAGCFAPLTIPNLAWVFLLVVVVLFVRILRKFGVLLLAKFLLKAADVFFCGLVGTTERHVEKIHFAGCT